MKTTLKLFAALSLVFSVFAAQSQQQNQENYQSAKVISSQPIVNHEYFMITPSGLKAVAVNDAGEPLYVPNVPFVETNADKRFLVYVFSSQNKRQLLGYFDTLAAATAGGVAWNRAVESQASLRPNVVQHGNQTDSVAGGLLGPTIEISPKLQTHLDEDPRNGIALFVKLDRGDEQSYMLYVISKKGGVQSLGYFDTTHEAMDVFQAWTDAVEYKKNLTGTK